MKEKNVGQTNFSTSNDSNSTINYYTYANYQFILMAKISKHITVAHGMQNFGLWSGNPLFIAKRERNLPLHFQTSVWLSESFTQVFLSIDNWLQGHVCFD